MHFYNDIFLEVLDHHVPVKMVKIRSKPNPFITPEIRQLMRKHNQWHKLAVKTKDPLHWNGYKFCQEVKKEIRIAEKAYVRAQILSCVFCTFCIEYEATPPIKAP